MIYECDTCGKTVEIEGVNPPEHYDFNQCKECFDESVEEEMGERQCSHGWYDIIDRNVTGIKVKYQNCKKEWWE